MSETALSRSQIKRGISLDLGCAALAAAVALIAPNLSINQPLVGLACLFVGTYVLERYAFGWSDPDRLAIIRAYRAVGGAAFVAVSFVSFFAVIVVSIARDPSGRLPGIAGFWIVISALLAKAVCAAWALHKCDASCPKQAVGDR